MKAIIIAVVICILCVPGRGQHIRQDLPARIDPRGFYLFYLHGGVVTVKGDNAISDGAPEFGPYQYSRILDTLRAHGFHVISERRYEDIEDAVYARKIKGQIDTLLNARVPVRNIIVVGASAGSNVVILASGLLKNPEMKFVIMGGCWPETYKDYVKTPISGRFLSIIESTDPHGTCAQIFEKRKSVKDFHEIKLETGLSHGFIYKPYSAWVNPLVQWFQIFAQDYDARHATPVDNY